jgi:hypothetical protein
MADIGLKFYYYTTSVVRLDYHSNSSKCDQILPNFKLTKTLRQTLVIPNEGSLLSTRMFMFFSCSMTTFAFGECVLILAHGFSQVGTESGQQL